MASRDINTERGEKSNNARNEEHHKHFINQCARE